MRPELCIYTYKDGLLSRLAHDLKLNATHFQLRLDHGKLSATIDPRSLRVLGVMHDGTLDETGLSASDRQKVERSIIDDVLSCDDHPTLGFEGQVSAGSSGRFQVRGTLQLHGRSEAINAEVTFGESLRCELELTPSRWGIKPFKAMAGALKVQDRVRVVVQLPVDTSALNQDNWSSAQMTWSVP